MAVKNAQTGKADKAQINSPVFTDGSALTIPTLSVLQADGPLIKGAKGPKIG
jgi:hypothetical protein